MHVLDYVVLAGYFTVMASIGLWFMRQNKAQEDYFMGGRSFGKLLQTFAAFGAGTGSSDPVNTGRTTFTSGMSGMWSVMYWLFVTPFYWITAVWYRRMRHLTLGDWFVERYESRALGAAYAVFGIIFYIFYGSMLFSAIGKVAAPLIGTGTVAFAGQEFGIEYVLVPVVGVVVLIYGIIGGLRAAYVTDLIQGLCIILLSVLLIPAGTQALLDKYDVPETERSFEHAMTLLHENLPPDYFEIVGSSSSSEFPLHRIIAIVIINLVGVVIQPHFIATGGGSAKTEMNARVGLVLGNLLKRLCTVGWVLTALIALALFADSAELAADPDRTWGVASRELLGPGLTGLMLACLLAALMSSVDAYMIIGSALVVRNIYAPFINPNASEAQYIRIARITGVFIVGGAVVVSLQYMNVFEQLKLTWIVNVLFAAPFWVGMYWRRGTTAAAWGTVAFCASVFFIIPDVAPRLWPALAHDARFLDTNEIVLTTTSRTAAPSDVAQRSAAISVWQTQSKRIDQRLSDLDTALATPDASEQQLLEAERNQLLRQRGQLGRPPEALQSGELMVATAKSGGQSIFWSDGVQAVDDAGNVRDDVIAVPAGDPQRVSDSVTRQVLRYPEGVKLQGSGDFRLDFLLYKALGIDLTQKTDALLSTLELPPKIVTPFLVMIGLSWLTRPNSKKALDRYYVKMRTPPDPDRQADQQKLEKAYADPQASESKKLFPGSQLEFQRPTWIDVVGFVGCFIVCFGIIGLAIWVTGIGG